MVALFFALLLFSVHLAQAFKNDEIICEVLLVWDFDFKNPRTREFVCETVFTEETALEKDLPPIVRLDISKDLIATNKEALKNHEWYISFPSSWLSGKVIDISSDEEAVSIVDPAIARKHLKGQTGLRSKASETKVNRQARETESEENALVILVSTNDVAVDFTPTQATEIVFGNGQPGHVSAASQFEACSFGEFKLVPYGNVLAITVDGNAVQYDKDTIGLEARKQVCAYLGLSEVCSPGDANVDHLIYVVPFGLSSDIPGSPGFAKGEVGGRYTIFQGMAFAPSTILHEMGHNFNLGHAREGNDLYGDDTGMMGSSLYTSIPNGDKRCFNGWNMWEMGWLKDRRYEVDAANPVLVKLATFVDYKLTSPDQFINIRVGNYYLTYNRAKGMNENTWEYRDKILVVKMLEDASMVIYHDTDLVAALDADTDTTFRAEHFDNTNQPLVIEVCNIVAGPPDYAEIAVGLNADCDSIRADVQILPPTVTPTRFPTSPPDNPAPTLSPTTSPTLPPTSPPTRAPRTELPTSIPTSPPTVPPTEPPTPGHTNPPPSSTAPPTSPQNEIPDSPLPTTLPPTTVTPTPANSPLDKNGVIAPIGDDGPTKRSKSSSKIAFEYMNAWLLMTYFTIIVIAC